MSTAKQSRTLAFISASGGVGKTTLSVLFAAYLQHVKGVPAREILLVDLDPTAGLSLLLLGDENYAKAEDEGKTLSAAYEDLFKRSRRVEPERYICEAPFKDSYFKVLVPGESFPRVVEELWRPGNPGESFRRLLEELGVYSSFRYVVVDSAPFFDERYTVLSLYSSDKYAVVLRPSIVDFRRTLRMIRYLAQHHSGRLGGSTGAFYSKILAVYNLVDTGTREASALAERGIRNPEGKEEGKAKPSQEVLKGIDSLSTLVGRVADYYVPAHSDIARLDVIGKLKKKKEKAELSPVLKQLADWAEG